MKTFVLSLGAAVSLMAVQANAEVMVADTDGNGTYSLEELVVSSPARTADVFAAIDANADGAVDADELKAAVEAGVVTE
jgi:hypothetical protein